jgi:hypothetical protein
MKQQRLRSEPILIHAPLWKVAAVLGSKSQQEGKLTNRAIVKSMTRRVSVRQGFYVSINGRIEMEALPEGTLVTAELRVRSVRMPMQLGIPTADELRQSIEARVRSLS